MAAGPALFAGPSPSPSCVVGAGCWPPLFCFFFPGKTGTANPSCLQVGAGPAALRLGRAELAWLRVVTGLVPVAAVGAGPALAACVWREGKWEPPLPALPHPTGHQLGSLQGPFLGWHLCVSALLCLREAACAISTLFSHLQIGSPNGSLGVWATWSLPCGGRNHRADQK